MTFSHSASLWCSLLSPHISLQNVCDSTEFQIQRLWVFSALVNCSKVCPWFLTILLILINSRVKSFNFCTHSNYLLLHFFTYNVESLSSNIVFAFQPIFTFLLNVSFLLFSSKMFKKSKSRLSSYNFLSNRLFQQGSFFVFGSLLAPNNSEAYAAAPCIVLFSSVRFWISIFLMTEFIFFTAHFTFALGIPHNVFNCSCFCYIKI